MAGVLFVICVPTEIYEKSFQKSRKNSDFEEDEESFHNLLSSDENLLLPNESEAASKSKTTFKTKSVKIPNYSTFLLINKHDEVSSSTVSDNYEKVNINKMPLEKVLHEILECNCIKNAVWTKGESGKYFQVIFPFESGYLCEGILALLNEYGIGQRLNSSVSVIPCSLFYKNEDGSGKLDLEENFDFKSDNGKNTAWNRFVTSVRARLTVAQVVEGVRAHAALTFDFVMLLLVATTLAAISLAENNNVYLVSSMLISPMMGPVLAGTFGQVIQDKKLQKIGVMTEMVGVLIATAVGFCYGSACSAFTDKYGENSWPTDEMSSRGELRSLWVGALIALLSGAAVALGTLGDNIASLVGVAISASLMPPAVNAGLLWGMAIVYAMAGENSTKAIVRTNFYSTDSVLELAALGAVSMCLTFVNIICIYIAGILVFKIKEVAPISSKETNRRFWKHDIKIARNYNLTLQKEEASTLSKQIINKDVKNVRSKEELLKFADHLYQSTEVKREHVVDIKKTQNTWSPRTLVPKRPTIQELKALYFFFGDDKPKAQKNLNFQEKTPLLGAECSSQSKGEISGLQTIPENIAGETSTFPQQLSEKQTFTGRKKFVVTPAKIEN